MRNYRDFNFCIQIYSNSIFRYFPRYFMHHMSKHLSSLFLFLLSPGFPSSLLFWFPSPLFLPLPHPSVASCICPLGMTLLYWCPPPGCRTNLPATLYTHLKNFQCRTFGDLMIVYRLCLYSWERVGFVLLFCMEYSKVKWKHAIVKFLKIERNRE